MQRKRNDGWRIATGLSPGRSPLTLPLARRKPAFAGRRQSAPRIATFSTSTRPSPGQFSPSHIGIESESSFAVLAQPPQVMSSIWNCMVVTPFIGRELLPVWSLASVGKVKRNLSTRRRFASPVATKDGAIPLHGTRFGSLSSGIVKRMQNGEQSGGASPAQQ